MLVLKDFTSLLEGEFIVCVFCFVGDCNEEPGYFQSWAEWFLGLQFLTLALLTFWVDYCCAVLSCAQNVWGTFLASTHQMPVVHPLCCDSQKCLCCQMSRGTKSSQVEKNLVYGVLVKTIMAIVKELSTPNRFMKSDRLHISLWVLLDCDLFLCEFSSDS